MSNKMGSWNLRINYGVKAVSDYMYHVIISTLQCLVSEADENNASRSVSFFNLFQNFLKTFAIYKNNKLTYCQSKTPIATLP
jgi:hypothetical protein